MTHLQVELIDLQFLGHPLAIAAYLLDDGADAALVEVGPTSTAQTLLMRCRRAALRWSASDT